MTITQTVDIPADRRITVNVPREVPVGRAILTFVPVTEPAIAETAEGEETEYTILSKERAVSMTAEVIEKYRPALDDLAK